MADAPTVPPAAATTAAVPRLLLIDDDAGLRRLAARQLARRGYQVTAVADGAEGVALAAAGAFDAVAVDHYMPGLDGLETLARLRQLPDPPPVVYVTGSEEGRVAVAALKAGAADYVVKTVGEDFFDLLAAAVGQVSARAALERAKARAEAELRAGNARLAALLAEVNHRVANSLQLVTAMVRLQAGALADGPARAALADTQRRIEAISQVHRRLYTANDVASVDMPDYLGALVAELGESWAGGAGGAGPLTLSCRVEPIRLPTDQAVSVGVIVTELVTNAGKYAYGPAGGEVRVSLGRAGDGFELVVADDGRGLVAGAAPAGTGLGARLVAAMARSLGAAVAYADGPGTRASVRFEA